MTAYWLSYEDYAADNKPGAEEYGILWEADPYEEENPLYTDADGRYAWDVPEGWWRVKAEHPEYETVWSDWLPVPPPQTEVNLAMHRITPASDYQIIVDEKNETGIQVTLTNQELQENEAVTVLFCLAAYDDDGRMVGSDLVSKTVYQTEDAILTLQLDADTDVDLVKGFVMNAETMEILRSAWQMAW